MTGAVADALGRTKDDLITGPDRAGGWSIQQTGGEIIGDRFDLGLAPTWSAVTGRDRPAEAVIETFVVEPGGGCIPAAIDPALGEAWAPVVKAMASEVFDALATWGVTPGGPAYATASLTPSGLLTGEPHLDDDRFVSGDGVGLVALVGDLAGARIATTPVPCGPVRPGLPVEIDPAAVASFGLDPAVQQVDPNRIVAFPQFGQLHAGPRFDPPAPGRPRSLIVLRAPTVPRQRRRPAVTQ